MFKVHERHGTWAVSKDSKNVKFLGGETIDYSMYKELKGKPLDAGKHFQRNAKGRLILKNPKKAA